MKTYTYRVRLTSDAEPGTGLGGETFNELIPRDHDGQPALRASHIKGLMREAFVDVAAQFGWDAELEARVFGVADRVTADDPVIRLKDAIAKDGGVTSRFVTRTALGEDGVVVEKSLRTTETVPVGTLFEGKLYSTAADDSVEELAWQLALRAIPAIGGGRNRGCGQCVIEIDDEAGSADGQARQPGTLLKELHRRMQDGAWKQETAAARGGSSELAKTTAVLRLTFEADTPICCPEFPDKTNVIRSGFAIPASAVQGVMLHRINATNPALADKLYECDHFRAWPLHPTGYLVSKNKDQEDNAKEVKVEAAIRVSLTHRAKKFSAGGEALGPNDFQDEAIAPYDWTETARGAPLKATDGVLLVHGPTNIQLWSERSMPHTISSHGVHNDPNTTDGRNLFTVDAMAPLRWQGIVVLPENVADALQKSLTENPIVAIGKSRTVRGIGRLTAERVPDDQPVEWQNRNDSKSPHTILVAQSPLLVESENMTGSDEDLLAELVSQWAAVNALKLPPNKQWANAGVRFGWNRTVKQGRLSACKVFLPGTVIAFESRLDEKALGALKNGIGGGRQRGYGAVSVHPGKAVREFKRVAGIPTLNAPRGAKNQQGAIQCVLDMASTTKRLPSPAQVRAVQQRVHKHGQASAQEYLKNQMEERPTRIWHTWEPIINQVSTLLLDASKFNQTDASRALALLADLSNAQQASSD